MQPTTDASQTEPENPDTGSTIYVIQYVEEDSVDYIPLIHDEEQWPSRYYGRFKIGVTTDVQRRLSALQGGTPNRLRLITTISPVGDAEAVEEHLHQYFDPMRLRGEWFRLGRDAVLSLETLEELSAEAMARVRRDSLCRHWKCYDTMLLHEVELARDSPASYGQFEWAELLDWTDGMEYGEGVTANGD